ncbi:MAG: hypothetical protein H6578_00015 [Chitinophagales bacterium]|nr:hypothetical protein [Chitinophagales bacterium]
MKIKSVLKVILCLSIIYLLIWYYLIVFHNFDILLFALPSDLVKFFPNYATLVHVFIKYTFFSALVFIIVYPFFLLKTFTKLQVITFLLLVVSLLAIFYPSINTIKSLVYWSAPFYQKSLVENINCEHLYEIEINDKRYEHHQSYLDFIIYLNNQLKKYSSDFEKTSFIRKKTAELIDLGEDYTCLSKTNIKWGELSSQQFYDFFYKDSFSVFCGGASLFLKNVFEDLGYKSYRYDMGEKFATHQTNIVHLDDEKKWIVQDAYFNGTFVDVSTNKPIDFFILLEAIQNNTDSNFVFQQDVYDYKTDFISYNTCDEINSKNWSIIQGNELYRSKHSGYLKLKNNRYLSIYLKDGIISDRIKDVLKEHFSVNQINTQTFKKLFILNKASSNEEWLNDSIRKILTNE